MQIAIVVEKLPALLNRRTRFYMWNEHSDVYFLYCTPCSSRFLLFFLGADDNLGPYNFERELRQAMNVPMSESFDGNEMFSQDEQFKTDLTPLDLEGLQMLEDPSNVLTDPATEDQLRLC